MYKAITVLGLLLLSAACSSISTESDFDAGTDFSNYKTFAFISDSPLMVAQAEPLSPLFEGRVMTATRNELTNKGFEFIENRDEADFVISITMGSRDKIRVNSYPTTYRGGPGGWGWGAPYYNTEVDVRNYTEGTLAIDVFDVEARGPVWHGWAVKTISNGDRSNPTPVINKVVAAILTDFPPG